MSEFTEKMNLADRLARLFLSTRIPAVTLEEKLVELGFFDIDMTSRGVEATYVAARWRLGHA